MSRGFFAVSGRTGTHRSGGGQRSPRLAQFSTPAELLSHPRDSFVADFAGRDRGYRVLVLDDRDVPQG